MLKLLEKIAVDGRMVCDTIDVRRLWYAGLVRWCSLTEVCITAKGLAMLYEAEERGEI